MTYGYIRVSTDKQDTENQKIGISAKAAFLHTQIDEWISDDGISGAKEPDKRLLGVLLEKLKKGDVIIASEISRLGRKLFMVMRILEHCMKVEAKVYTVKDGYELGDNIQSKVLAFAFGLAAEIERDMIQKRTIEGLARRKAQGVILGRPVGRNSGVLVLAGREDEVKAYLEQGLSYRQVGRVFNVNQATISNLIKLQGWEPNPVRGSRPVKQLIAFRIFNQEQIDELAEMVKHEPSSIKMIEHLKVKHHIELTQTRLITYLKQLGLHDTWVITNNRLRSIYNVDCGKNKR